MRLFLAKVFVFFLHDIFFVKFVVESIFCRSVLLVVVIIFAIFFHFITSQTVFFGAVFVVGAFGARFPVVIDPFILILTSLLLIIDLDVI